jgi:hypothetical protein
MSDVHPSILSPDTHIYHHRILDELLQKNPRSASGMRNKQAEQGHRSGRVVNALQSDLELLSLLVQSYSRK